MKPIGIGLIGFDLMGHCHATAYSAVAGIFDVPLKPELKMLTEATPELAEQSATNLLFQNSTSERRKLVEKPDIELVDITAANHLHNPITLAAIKLCKPVYCEKPLTCTLEEARELCETAELTGILTIVGYNYLQNPMIQTDHEIINSGEISEPVGFRGVHAEDYMAGPKGPLQHKA